MELTVNGTQTLVTTYVHSGESILESIIKDFGLMPPILGVVPSYRENFEEQIPKDLEVVVNDAQNDQKRQHLGVRMSWRSGMRYSYSTLFNGNCTYIAIPVM